MTDQVPYRPGILRRAAAVVPYTFYEKAIIEQDFFQNQNAPELLE
jgi:hypothetical protein